jgi:Zn-dependent M28 family amino/carboxypeptidase
VQGLVAKGLIASLVFGAFTVAAQQVDDKQLGERWWQHVKVLADDNMEGRETGSPGMKRAADYVVSQLKQDGLKPAGTNGFYQPVKLVKRTLDESKCSLTLVRDGKDIPVKLGDEAIFSTRVDLASSIDAPLVFAGYALKVPEKNYDDFAGLDVKGKVVVYISGAPSEIPGDLASHYQSAGERWKALKAAGAIGTIGIPNPAAMDIPWSRIMVSRLQPSMKLADPSFDETQGWQLSATWNPAVADKLLEGTGHKAADLFALVKEKKPLPHFDLNEAVKAKTKIDYANVDSFNIVGKLEGSDPKLKSENVVLSAHLDHVGIGQPVASNPNDRIYNGAMDNASGTSILLEVARRIKEQKMGHKRTLLFVFVTGEEKGLLGSRYFARKPTVSKNSIVGDVNTDMFLPINPPKSIIVRGMAESDLGDWAKAAVEKAGATPRPDPAPERNGFIRSDQYSFIREGIPSVVMSIGYEKGTPEEHNVQQWLKERYHAPSDDLDQPVNFEAAGKYEEVLTNLLISAANAEHRPEWKTSSFFKRFAGGK